MANGWQHWAKRPEIVDDRGGTHLLVSVMMLRRDPRHADARFRLVTDRASRHFRPSRLAGLLGAFAGLMFAFVMPFLQKRGIPIWYSMIGFYALIIVLGRFAARGMMRKASPGIVSSLLTDGLCPGVRIRSRG